jgi:hypothetical protein
MFLIRMAFWIGLVVLLLPTDERQQARLYGAATAAVERVTTFCDRNAKACAAGSDLWASFLRKAEFGARMAFDLVANRASGGRDEETVPVEPANATGNASGSAKGKAEKKPAPRGTLTPADLNPPWRGQPQRTGA